MIGLRRKSRSPSGAGYLVHGSAIGWYNDGNRNDPCLTVVMWFRGLNTSRSRMSASWRNDGSRLRIITHAAETLVFPLDWPLEPVFRCAIHMFSVPRGRGTGQSRHPSAAGQWSGLINPGMGWTLHFYSNAIENYGSKLEPSDTLDDWPGLSTIDDRLRRSCSNGWFSTFWQ